MTEHLTKNPGHRAARNKDTSRRPLANKLLGALGSEEGLSPDSQVSEGTKPGVCIT